MRRHGLRKMPIKSQGSLVKSWGPESSIRYIAPSYFSHFSTLTRTKYLVYVIGLFHGRMIDNHEQLASPMTETMSSMMFVLLVSIEISLIIPHHVHYSVQIIMLRGHLLIITEIRIAMTEEENAAQLFLRLLGVFVTFKKCFFLCVKLRFIQPLLNRTRNGFLRINVYMASLLTSTNFNSTDTIPLPRSSHSMIAYLWVVREPLRSTRWFQVCDLFPHIHMVIID